MKRLIYGINPVMEALKATDLSIKELLVSSKRSGDVVDEMRSLAKGHSIKVRMVSNDELENTAGTRNHQGVVLVCKDGFPYRHIDEFLSIWKKSGARAFFLILDSIEDPQNMGTLIRSASAAGVQGVIIPKDRSAEITPAVEKASAGATIKTPVAKVTNISNAIRLLKEAGVWVVGIEAEGKTNIYSAPFDGDLAIVVGSEGSGLRRLVKRECDLLASIPMRGTLNSLNAAQAGTVALFEAVRQRGG